MKPSTSAESDGGLDRRSVPGRAPVVWALFGLLAIALAGVAVATDISAARLDVGMADLSLPNCAAIAAGQWPPASRAAAAVWWSLGAVAALLVATATLARQLKKQRSRVVRALLALVLIGLPVVGSAVLITATDRSSYPMEVSRLAAQCQAENG